MPIDSETGWSPGTFGYFAVRIHWPVPAEAAGVTGVVERLGTGEKQEFQSVLDLARFLCEPPTTDPPGGPDV